jgi:hypothetical protein
MMPAPNSTDSNFERTFADLAFARLRDKAPSLLNYLIGFQLIDKNDDETHAVGVFGFKVGKEWVYAPVFFINGELKGHELMYIKSQDAFVPMTEQWVNYTLNRRPKVLGEAENQERSKLGIRPPDFNIFSGSPFRGSKSSAQTKGTFNSIVDALEKRNPEFAPFMSVFTVSPTNEKYASVNENFNLPNALSNLGKQAAINLFETLKQDNALAEAIFKFYPVEDLVSFKKKASGLDTTTSKQRKGKTTIPPVVVTRGDDGSNVSLGLSDEEKKKLLKDQYVVVDNRAEDEKSKIYYKTQLASTITSPDISGCYDLLTSSGDIRKAVVLVNPLRIGYQDNYDGLSLVTTVLDPADKKTSAYYNSDIMSVKQHPSEDFKKFYDGLKDASSVGNQDEVILVGPDGKSTSSFTVENKLNHPDGRAEFKVWGHQRLSSGSTSLKNKTTIHTYQDSINSIVLTDKEGTNFTRIGNTLFVPKAFKAYVVKEYTGKDRGGAMPASPDSSSNQFNIGTFNDIVTTIQKQGEDKKSLITFELKTDGIRFTPQINGTPLSPMSKVASLKYLIVNHGLGQEDAEFLIKEANPRKKITYIIKYAYGEPPMSATFNEPVYEEEEGLKAKLQLPQRENQFLGQNDNDSARELYANDRYMDDNAKSHAQTASSLGQKEVLDTAVITGLVKTLDTSEAVDGYIGDLLLGLDRLGRILFMYYWHNDKFKERYGQQDMIELEDNCRNVFKNLGELTLFLKQKTIEPDQGNNSEVELDSILGD